MIPVEKKISILGCGWLGLPLAEYLHAHGNMVKGSTTSFSKLKLLEDKGIFPYLINLEPDFSGSEDYMNGFLSSEYLIINIPPGTKRNPESDFHVNQIRTLIKYLQNSEVRKIIFISSTSVYPDMNKIIVEDDLTEEAQAGNKILYRAEQLILSCGKDVTVLRCGGLTGYDRILVNFFSGKSNLPGGNCPVNLIHRDDLVRLIGEVCGQEKIKKIYNACTPFHPLKKVYYPHIAKKLGLPEPSYKYEDSPNYKIIDSAMIQQDTGFKFVFPDPMKFTFKREN